MEEMKLQQQQLLLLRIQQPQQAAMSRFPENIDANLRPGLIQNRQRMMGLTQKQHQLYQQLVFHYKLQQQQQAAMSRLPSNIDVHHHQSQEMKQQQEHHQLQQLLFQYRTPQEQQESVMISSFPSTNENACERGICSCCDVSSGIESLSFKDNTTPILDLEAELQKWNL